MPPFTPYQRFVVAALAFLQFTVVLDFMIVSPLGAFLLRDLGMSTAQFGAVVSAYAFSAGASGVVASGFADRFDRKRFLLFFYVGFLAGTLACGLAPTYAALLAARVVTGLFGGVIGSISIAIVTDLFPAEVRGRVMGVVQSAFAASQVLGIPIGLALATRWGWNSAFLMIVAFGVPAGVLLALRLRPVVAHLEGTARTSPAAHMLATATRPRYLAGYAATALLATGGFMLMPFGSAFAVNNLRVPVEQLPTVYVATGLCAMVAGPALGRLSDRVGKLPLFAAASLGSATLVLAFTRLGPTPIVVVALNAALFVTITGRMVSSMALVSALPDLRDRGAYMAIQSSLQQVSGGVGAWTAGHIVAQRPDGVLLHYERLGQVVAGAIAVTVVLMANVHRVVGRPRAGA